jgi:hypothetical protein
MLGEVYVDRCPGKQSGGNEGELSCEHPELSSDTRKAHAAVVETPQ